MLQSVIDFLTKIGFFDIILPFLLVWSITYGVLYRTKIFGNPMDEKEGPLVRNLNSIVSFCMAGLFISAKSAVSTVKTLIPAIAGGLIAILGLVMLIGFVLGGYEEALKHKGVKIALGVAGGIAFAAILISAFNLWSWFQGAFRGAGGALSSEEFYQIIGTVIVLAVLGFVIWLVTRTPKKSSS